MRSASQNIEQRVNGARSATEAEWREHRRRPFFRPVSIEASSDPALKVAGFCMSISSRSVLMLHDAPLKTGSPNLIIPTPIGKPIVAKTAIISTELRGGQWHISQGTFQGLSSLEYTKLFVATIKPNPDRRASYRSPCYCPVSIAMSDNHSEQIAGISRDISITGLAFLHKEPFLDRSVTINFDDVGLACGIRLEIKRRKEFPGGWYECGGEFKSLFIEELPRFGA